MACQIRHKLGVNYAHCRAAPRVGRNSLALEDTKARNQSSPSKLIACLIRNAVGGGGGEGGGSMLTVVRFRVLARNH